MKTVYKCSYCDKEFNVTNECLKHEISCDKKVDTSYHPSANIFMNYHTGRWFKLIK